MIRSIIMAAVLVCGGAAAQTTPEDISADLSARNERIITALNADKQSGALSSESALALIQKEMSPRIDYRRLSSSATGKHWRKANDVQKDEIIKAFRAVLEKTYAKVLARYTEQQSRIVDVKERADKTIVVNSEIYGTRGNAKMDYVFAQKDGKALIIDMQVEGISLISAYRRQFNQIAKKAGIDGLVAKLRELADK